MSESLQNVVTAVDTMNDEGIIDLVQRCLDEGMKPVEIIEQGLSKGMDIVGQKFESGEYYLADLIMAGETVTRATEMLKTKMEPGQTGKKGKVVLATVQGDIHDIGKKIVAMILESSGYEIIDLGVDVPPADIVDAMKNNGARLVGLSVLLTTMVEGIREVTERLKSTGMRDSVRIAIGGACCTQQLADEMGADAFGESAVAASGIFDRFRADLGMA
jgi:corrinoid protein of di/trimethylamine methyltransferase